MRPGRGRGRHRLLNGGALWHPLGVDDKQALRERVWARIDAASEVRRAPGAVGRIPNFVGAEQAAQRLAECPEWQAARVLKMNPDSPQLWLRARAIADGKL